MLVPMSVLPVTFAECGLAPKTLGQRNLGLRVLGHQNRDDIEAIFYFVYVKNASIYLRRAGYLPLLPSINISDHGRKLIRATRLDLDKTKGFAIQCD